MRWQLKSSWEAARGPDSGGLVGKLRQVSCASPRLIDGMWCGSPYGRGWTSQRRTSLSSFQFDHLLLKVLTLQKFISEARSGRWWWLVFLIYSEPEWTLWLQQYNTFWSWFISSLVVSGQPSASITLWLPLNLFARFYFGEIAPAFFTHLFSRLHLIAN